MEEWKKYKLGELVLVKGGKRLPKGINLIPIPNSHPYIRVRDLGDSKYIELNRTFEYVDEETQKQISRYTVNTGNILISIVGTIGLVALVGESLNFANLTENCVKLVELNKIDNDFLYYFLISSLGQSEIAKGIVGAVQAKLPIKNIQDISLMLPPLNIQKQIANILSSLDDKIALNKRINDNLTRN
jgi:type I restriction enzyme S subunit